MARLARYMGGSHEAPAQHHTAVVDRWPDAGADHALAGLDWTRRDGDRAPATTETRDWSSVDDARSVLHRRRRYVTTARAAMAPAGLVMPQRVTAMDKGETPKMIVPVSLEKQKCGICGFVVIAQSPEALRQALLEHRLYTQQEGLHGPWRN